MITNVGTLHIHQCHTLNHASGAPSNGVTVAIYAFTEEEMDVLMLFNSSVIVHFLQEL